LRHSEGSNFSVSKFQSDDFETLRDDNWKSYDLRVEGRWLVTLNVSPTNSDLSKKEVRRSLLSPPDSPHISPRRESVRGADLEAPLPN